MHPSRILLTGLAAALPAIASANGTALPDTVGVALRPGNATELGLEANFGWLSAADGTSFSWVCHETVLDPTSTLTPFYYLGENVTFTTVRSLGVSVDPQYSLFRSTDGCDWEPPADLAGVNVREVTFDPADPDRMLAATFTGSGANNGVWVSTDNGAHWSKTHLDLAERFFRSVKFSRAGAGRVYATATWYQPQPQAWVYVSDNGGLDWTEIPWVFSVSSTLQSNVDIIATSPADPDIAFARTNGGTDYLLRTSDGGVSWHTVFQKEDDVRGLAFESGTGAIWLGTVFNGTWRSTDGGLTFSPIANPPATRGLAADPRGVFVVANNYEDGFALGVTTDQGASFSKVFQFHELAGPRPCPAGSDVATICEPLWPALAQRLGITTPTPTPTPGGGGGDDGGGTACACRFGTGASAFTPIATALLLLAGAMLRRRARDLAEE